MIFYGPQETGTIRRKLLLGVPLTLTNTGPVVAPDGTFATIALFVQEVTVAATPLKVIALDPCVAPNKSPAIVTVTPTAAGFGTMLVIVGSVATTELTIIGVVTDMVL